MLLSISSIESTNRVFELFSVKFKTQFRPTLLHVHWLVCETATNYKKTTASAGWPTGTRLLLLMGTIMRSRIAMEIPDYLCSVTHTTMPISICSNSPISCSGPDHRRQMCYEKPCKNTVHSYLPQSGI